MIAFVSLERFYVYQNTPSQPAPFLLIVQDTIINKGREIANACI